jgi:SPP1 gp7 family putative phage head morphogenesis protein
VAKVPHNSGRFFRPGPVTTPGHSDVTYEQLKLRLSDLYAIDCCSDQKPPSGGLGVPDLISEDELDKLITSLLKSIFNNRSIANAPEALYQMFVDQLWEAVVKGYGTDIADVDFDTPDYRMLEALQEDVIKFSAAKDDAMNKAIFKELTDNAGNIRSFADFKKAASVITDDHVKTWLKSEYNFAVASGQMNVKWQRIQNEKEFLPLLQYDTVGDDRVRPAHRELDGIIRNVDDAFWNTYFPPNGWNCRCDVRQLADGDETPMDQIITPEQMPALFKNNLAKNKKIFPPDHPYYK